ncbi:MAG: ROK family protein [Chloroflexota bacterium]|nr:ROK family protein [Chloroflexota bacterium]
MKSAFKLKIPQFVPPLDPGFRPAALANRAFRQEVHTSGGGVPLVLGIERQAGVISRYETVVFPPEHPRASANLRYVERLVKFLLWQRGGWRVYVGGPRAIGEYLQSCYQPDGIRAFDYEFMGRIFEQPFTVVPCATDEVPPANETAADIGGQLDGCRIGFDLGASDRKVSAVIDGEPVYSEEVVWEPRKQTDPAYHYHEIMTALQTAASKMPRVDAIGGSSAGVYINNRPMVASLFRGIPEERYDRVKSLFLRLGEEWGVPFTIINDGDVTALAGAMSLEATGVLGIALGSSEAGGYVDTQGKITGWLNELAFTPIDYQLGAPAETDWSGDSGIGSLYLSQQCVFRLAPQVGIEVPEGVTKAGKLKAVQVHLEAGEEGARQIWETLGIYLGYAIAHYADFYEIEHVLILGRCTSGRGGGIMLAHAQRVLAAEFPELAERIHIQLPDEKSRRVGQAIAAASLPVLHKPTARG